MAKIESRILHEAIRSVVSRYNALAMHANPQDIQFQLSRRVARDIEAITRPITGRELEEIINSHALELNGRYSNHSLMDRQVLQTASMENFNELFGNRVISYGDQEDEVVDEGLDVANKLSQDESLPQQQVSFIVETEVLANKPVKVKQIEAKQDSTTLEKKPRIVKKKKAVAPKAHSVTETQVAKSDIADAQPLVQNDNPEVLTKPVVQETKSSIDDTPNKVDTNKSISVVKLVKDSENDKVKPVSAKKQSRKKTSADTDVKTKEDTDKAAKTDVEQQTTDEVKTLALPPSDGFEKSYESFLVRRLRKHYGMGHTEFSQKTGISMSTLKSWEAGRRIPSGAGKQLIILLSKRPDLIKLL